eukprot:TRINITY_DN1275_c0_g1_i1.p2 TRINITY_DN1275_c0_g1~~TRINITY_DN1275_c0_g1_i1.p2  ORF type:complete len:143 (-),score=40.90 TRINITY_DN1275_c0_g1_i1:79-507(-)
MGKHNMAGAAAGGGAGDGGERQGNVLLLEEELREVDNSIRHLIRSNIQLTAALQDSYDKDFEQAWLENKATIAKKQQLAKALRTMIKEALGPHGATDNDSSAALPEPVDSGENGTMPMDLEGQQENAGEGVGGGEEQQGVML